MMQALPTAAASPALRAANAAPLDAKIDADEFASMLRDKPAKTTEPSSHLTPLILRDRRKSSHAGEDEHPLPAAPTSAAGAVAQTDPASFLQHAAAGIPAITTAMALIRAAVSSASEQASAHDERATSAKTSVGIIDSKARLNLPQPAISGAAGPRDIDGVRSKTMSVHSTPPAEPSRGESKSIADAVEFVSVETHLPVTIPETPAAQLVQAMFQDVPDADVKAAAVASGENTPPERPPREHVRTLVVDLQPESLGPVQVRMRLVGKELQVGIVARTHDAVTALDGSRLELSARISDAGYRLCALDIGSTASGPDGGAPQGEASQRDGAGQGLVRRDDTGSRTNNGDGLRHGRRHSNAPSDDGMPRRMPRHVGDLRL